MRIIALGQVLLLNDYCMPRQHKFSALQNYRKVGGKFTDFIKRVTALVKLFKFESIPQPF